MTDPKLDKLELRTAIDHWKAKGLDYSNILYRPDVGPEVGTFCQMKQDHLLDQSLDIRSILEGAKPAIDNKKPVVLNLPVVNTDRVVGTITGAEISRIHGRHGLPEDTVRINLSGSAGQSLGAFCPQGMTFFVDGDTNDYCGKGLSGATISIKLREESNLISNENTIIGNTVLYGATSGNLFAAGQAGERFAVRNSGATSVVEGCGSNGCEYMTGGTVIILGTIGDNFGAGMTGGMAFVYDEEKEFEKKVNPETVVWQRLETEYWKNYLKNLVSQHFRETNSKVSEKIINNFDQELNHFYQVCPKEMIDKLDNPITNKELQGFAS